MPSVFKEIFYEATHKRHQAVRMLICLIAVLGMSGSMSLLLLTNFGVDPCTLLDLAISRKFNIPLGHWHLFFNVILFIIVIRFGARNLGFGTLCNMILSGYVVQYGSLFWTQIIPAQYLSLLSIRISILIPALIVFCLSVALYMDVDMGITPYDAIPFIVSEKLPRVPFRFVRIGFDFTITLHAFLLGGRPGVLTALLVLLLGPVISGVNTWLINHVALFREF